MHIKMAYYVTNSPDKYQADDKILKQQVFLYTWRYFISRATG